jgi:hypothetical protein
MARPVVPPGGRVRPRRHCWVQPADGVRAAESEGLVVEWRSRPEHGWEALVVFIELRDELPAAVTCWVPAARLRPA